MVLDILEDLFERDEKEDKPGRKRGKDEKEKKYEDDDDNGNEKRDRDEDSGKKRGFFDRISELLD